MLGACGGGVPASPAQPSTPNVLTFLLSRGSLVVNQKVPTTVALSDFQFQIIVNGQVANTLPGNGASTTLRIPVASAQTTYRLNLVGPAGFILSQPCEGTSRAGTAVCSGQIVDTRAVCDDTVVNYVYKVTERLTLVNKCTAAIVTLSEISESDEDDSDQRSARRPRPALLGDAHGRQRVHEWLAGARGGLRRRCREKRRSRRHLQQIQEELPQDRTRQEHRVSRPWRPGCRGRPQHA